MASSMRPRSSAGARKNSDLEVLGCLDGIEHGQARLNLQGRTEELRQKTGQLRQAETAGS